MENKKRSYQKRKRIYEKSCGIAKKGTFDQVSAGDITKKGSASKLNLLHRFSKEIESKRLYICGKV
jgi:hypothetical protein